MRERLWVECGFFVVLGTAAIVLAGVFSGPMWLALSFVITNALHLFKAFTAEYYQRVLPSGPDLIQTQASYSRRMKNLAAFSRFAKLTPVIAVLLILVFRDGVGSDYLIPLALAPTALALTGWWVFREPNVLPKPNF